MYANIRRAAKQTECLSGARVCQRPFLCGVAPEYGQAVCHKEYCMEFVIVLLCLAAAAIVLYIARRHGITIVPCG